MDKFLRYGLIAVAAVAIASVALYGFPKDVVALTTPLTLVLLVVSLDRQTKAQKQAREDNLFAAQVQALVALIEDDRQTLADMHRDLREKGKKSEHWDRIVARRTRRLKTLNQLLSHQPLLAGAVTDETGADV